LDVILYPSRKLSIFISLFNLALSTKPIAAHIDIIAEPPYESIGIGTPTIGIKPVIIAQLIKKYRKIRTEIAPQAIELNRLLEINDVWAEIIIKYIKIEKINIPPINPVSSSNTANIKSLCFSGKKFN